MVRSSAAANAAFLVTYASSANAWINPSPKHPPHHCEALSRRAASASIATLDDSTAEGKSEELLSLLLVSASDRASRVNSLISDLAFPSPSAPPNSYDADQSLYGNLWCTVYAVNFANPQSERPLWERIASLRGGNLKGQQYFRGSSAKEGCGEVINYSEIWGPAVHLTASGSFRPQDEVGKGENVSDAKGQVQARGNGLGFDLGSTLSGWVKGSTNGRGVSSGIKSPRRTCPDDYSVSVSKGTISAFGITVELPIRGTGFLRVLYADERMRIFISPVDTNDSVLRGDWEREGLVVVQIRSDLVSTAGGIDLRM